LAGLVKLAGHGGLTIRAIRMARNVQSEPPASVAKEQGWRLQGVPQVMRSLRLAKSAGRRLDDEDRRALQSLRAEIDALLQE
jgi:hypothetical protein